MPRLKREDFPGAFHHVMNRGARRQPVFKQPEDCQVFLDLLGEVVRQFGIQVHAYSLMPNHYHLLVRSVRGNLSDAMQQLNGNYTGWLNRRHKWDGPVFRGRFKSQLVADQTYLRILLAYIHLNPVRARLVARITSEAWTSHRSYVGLESSPRWLTTTFFLGALGGKKGLDEFVHSVHRGVTRYPEEFNSETGVFRRKALDLAGRETGHEKQIRKGRGGKPPPVEQVIAEVCRITGATEAELMVKEYGPTANPARRFAVWALYRRGGVKQREIAKRMKGTYYQVTKLLSRLRKERAKEPLRTWMRDWEDSDVMSNMSSV